MIIQNNTENINNLTKYKRLIRKPCVSTLAWIKNNSDPILIPYTDKVERSAINILSWLENNPNPITNENTNEKLNELRQLKGSYSEAIINYCTKLTEEKANEIRVLKGKVNDNVFYYCDNITSGGWEKHTTTIELPQPVLEHQEYLDKTSVNVQDEE